MATSAMMATLRMRRALARILRRAADQIDKPTPITIDLKNNTIYADASNVGERDIDRMRTCYNAFFADYNAFFAETSDSREVNMTIPSYAETMGRVHE